MSKGDHSTAVVLLSVAAFGVTSWIAILWKRHNVQEGMGNSERVEVQSSRLVRYLSEHSDWSEYCDDDEFFIQDSPKVELHVHLDGTFDPHFLWKYMKEHPHTLYCLPVGTSPPWLDPPRELKIRSMVENCKTHKEFHELCTCRGYRSLEEMLNCFEVFLPLVRGNLNLIEQLAFDFCQRQWEQNVIYCEVRYSPHLFAEGFSDKGGGIVQSKVTPESVYQAVTKGLRRGCQEFKSLTVYQILCGINWRPDWALSTLDLALKHRNDGPCSVVGVDIAAGEEHFDKEKFSHLYGPHYEMAVRAMEQNMPITLHAGEATDNALENVSRAILDYGARRIGHGYRMTQCAETMQLVRDCNVHVEVCPTSSDETGGWIYDTREWTKHPVVAMREHGVAVSLSSDDPAVFHTSLAWQYRIALAKIGLRRKDLVQMSIDAVEAAWCSDEEKERLRNIIQCYGKEKGIDGYAGSCVDCSEASSFWERSSTESFSDRVYITSDEYL
jgi:adenosine deaminase